MHACILWFYRYFKMHEHVEEIEPNVLCRPLAKRAEWPPLRRHMIKNPQSMALGKSANNIMTAIHYPKRFSLESAPRETGQISEILQINPGTPPANQRRDGHSPTGESESRLPCLPHTCIELPHSDSNRHTRDTALSVWDRHC